MYEPRGRLNTSGIWPGSDQGFTLERTFSDSHIVTQTRGCVFTFSRKNLAKATSIVGEPAANVSWNRRKTDRGLFVARKLEHRRKQNFLHSGLSFHRNQVVGPGRISVGLATSIKVVSNAARWCSSYSSQEPQLGTIGDNRWAAAICFRCNTACISWHLILRDKMQNELEQLLIFSLSFITFVAPVKKNTVCIISTRNERALLRWKGLSHSHREVIPSCIIQSSLGEGSALRLGTHSRCEQLLCGNCFGAGVNETEFQFWHYVWSNFGKIIAPSFR